MAFSNQDYINGLNAVNDATNRLGATAGKINDVVTGVQTRVAAIADKLAAAPSAADVSNAATQLQAHAATLGQVSDALDAAETTLNGIGADPVTPAPVTPPIDVPPAPVDPAVA